MTTFQSIDHVALKNACEWWIEKVVEGNSGDLVWGTVP